MPRCQLPITLAAAFAALTAAAFAAGNSSIAARPIPRDRAPFPQPGTRVPQREVGTRTFVDARYGFALAEVSGRSTGGGATFPVRTTDGGRTWRIAGPHLHVNAADAPDVVTVGGIAGRRFFFAFGGPGGGQAIDVTTDAGARWWRAYLPTPPEAVAVSRVDRRIRLIAFLQGSPTRAYVSSDGGRRWRYTRSPG